jgi:shikimate dehydrogenase
VDLDRGGGQEISGATQVVAVIGEPIAHSLSPAIHNSAFASMGLDWVCVALPVGRGGGQAAVEGMRALGIRGMSVTMPHKADVIAALDELTPTARALGSVNCVLRLDGRLVGDSTDGAGFLAGLRDDFGLDPAGRRCVVLGAGGAARAVILALADAGATSVRVVGRTPERAQQAASLAGPLGSVGGPEDIRDAELIVNATPVGMGGGPDVDGLPVDPSLLGADQVVADLIYHPARTPLMAAAEAAGARTSNGLSMLVHQAAVAFTHWTQRPAPVAAMVAGATEAIARTR